MVWLLLGMVYMIMSPLAMSGGAPAMPEAIKHAINLALSGNIGAVTYTVGTTLGLLVLFLGRRFFVKPVVAWAAWSNPIKSSAAALNRSPVGSRSEDFSPIRRCSIRVERVRRTLSTVARRRISRHTTR